jgi:hypothetical protein
VENIVYFIKKNTSLQHLDLTSCGLFKSELEAISAALNKSCSVLSLHLCLNPGISKDLVEWIRTRIHCKPFVETVRVPPFQKKTKLSSLDYYDQQVHSQMTKANFDVYLKLPDLSQNERLII